ncbi:TIGR00730 family Rossman fold protein [Nonomuraea zeae]|uniref:Cytokinin riboside 5'-monophosphate phosphoribohydrolase n=1 Tax=Nonomuraea zeae TaxID=1642303 RepID=A0A5S4FEH1_9ACTN|nr:TIGR00730 family Rossman fold protein [Nonomuraea zeae]TMR16732.1 TIGR00730 family Rossman fold protein [Nonomuraea zeae]
MLNGPSRGKAIAVFCGARAGVHPHYLHVAGEFGAALARRGAALVYGAAGVGIMGAVASAVTTAGGTVTGVIPHHLYEREKPELASGDIFVVGSMHERKALMYDLSMGFAVLPGGLGTLDELMEVATWNQLQIHEKPIVLLNQAGFFDPLITMLDHVVAEGFLTQEERAAIRVTADIGDALDWLGLPVTPALPEESPAGLEPAQPVV